MKQILQDLKHGDTQIVEVPAPLCWSDHLLIATRRSLISAGTERMLVEFGRGSYLAKSRQQPEKVRQVLDKMQTDGIVPTVEAVLRKLEQPLPLGYCNAGVVLEVGEGVKGFAAGDRVVSNGPHAEIVSVPEKLCAKIPEGVGDEEAAFTVLGAVALQGVRLAAPTLGERVAVVGLGLLGLMTVQMLRANGCRVLGVDFDEERLALAREYGAETANLATAEDPVAAGMAFSEGRGMDAVLITAATDSDAPVQQAAQMSRQRGRIVLVGVAGLNLQRADFYEKELTFQVSCSYGPGRYDAQYEEQGHDYPFGLVRWTEQRNFEAVLQLLAEGKLDVTPMISERIPQAEAARAYRMLTNGEPPLGIVLTYPEQQVVPRRTVPLAPAVPARTAEAGRASIGMIGAGNFASGVLLPALAKTDAVLHSIASAGGTSAGIAARKFGFVQATTDYRLLLAEPAINTVFITTRHDTHAGIVVAALEAGKHVFVEKPLALNREELDEIRAAVGQAPEQQLLVGFNRRFAPLSVQMKELLAVRSQPLSLVYTVNAGALPAEHWTQDPAVGGGRIIGEGCHFVDLLRFLVGAPITGVEAQMMGEAPGVAVRQDKMTILLSFADGSTGAVHYLANGSKRFPKERVEAFSEGRMLVLDNFKKLEGYEWPDFGGRRLWRQDKGHGAEVAAFVSRVEAGGEWLIPWQELAEVTRATFVAVERAEEKLPGLTPAEPL